LISIFGDLDLRLLGIDVGEKRIGVAITDPTNTIAQPLSTIARGDGDIEAICDLARENDVGEIVVGLPINMNGTRGEMAEKVSAFAEKLRESVDIPVVYVDERLSTAEAERLMISADVSRRKRKKSIDKIAAAIILETRLRSRG
jgi:putative Holliday junction resolvase